jgi:hypothetical protein
MENDANAKSFVAADGARCDRGALADGAGSFRQTKPTSRRFLLHSTPPGDKALQVFLSALPHRQRRGRRSMCIALADR